jgi:hypothetical protein
MYRTSSLTFIYKYLFTPVLGGGFTIGLVFSQASNNPVIQKGSISVLIMLCVFLFWMFVMMIRLRSAEAMNDKLVIKTIQSQKSIEYKDILWITQLVMIKPVMISLKYHDRDTGVSKKILLMPERNIDLSGLNSFKELEMTKFIRGKAMEANPSYSKFMEPSRWLSVGLIFLSLIPVIVVYCILRFA